MIEYMTNSKQERNLSESCTWWHLYKFWHGVRAGHEVFKNHQLQVGARPPVTGGMVVKILNFRLFRMAIFTYLLKMW